MGVNVFDTDLKASGWFDEDLSPSSWFTEEVEPATNQTISLPGVSSTMVVNTPVVGQSTWTKRPQVSMSGRTVGFWEWKPASHAYATNLPCIIAIHGLGERGDGSSSGLNALLNTGIPNIINSQGYPYEAVVLCPQFPTSGSTMGLYDFNALFDYALANYNVDPDRIAVTGYSAGANSIIEVLAESYNADRVSCFVNCDTVYAYVPSIATTMNNGGLKSYWFQDTTDTTFGQPTYAQVQAWVAGLNDAGAVYRTGAGHGYWATVYQYNQLLIGGTQNAHQWMIAQVNGVGDKTITLSTVASTLVVNSPVITLQNQDIVLQTVASTMVVNSPSLSLNVQLSTVASTLVVNQPSLSLNISLPSVASTLVVNQPSLSLNVVLSGVASTLVVNSPIISQDGGDQFVVLPSVSSTLVVNQPVVIPGPVVIQLGTVGSTLVVNELILETEEIIVLPHVPSTLQVNQIIVGTITRKARFRITLID